MNDHIRELAQKFRAQGVKNDRVNSRWRANPTLKLLGEELISHFRVSISEALVLAELTTPPVCIVCGSSVKFSHKLHAFRLTCSTSCGSKNASSKVKQTNLSRYGTENPTGFGSKIHKQALLKKHGVLHPMQSVEIKNKIARTNLERYGVENVFSSASTKDQIKRTNLSKHSVPHNMQRPEVKAKFRTEHGEWKPSITNAVERARTTLFTVTESVRQRIAAHGFALLSTPSSFSYRDFHTVKHSCGHEFQSIIYSGSIPRCPKCDPMLKGTSKIELKLLADIQLFADTKTRTRPLNGKEIDILVPSHKLGIEVNGLYYHSELRGFARDYHLNKTELAANLGITLLHFYEDDLLFKYPVVLSMIKSKLGLCSKIAARKCKVQVLQKSVGTEFCEQNHLRGSAKFSTAYGLYFEDELMAVGTFSKARYDQSEFELIRFCTKLEVNVVGGLSRIISAFKKAENPKSLVSYADRSYSTGNAYLSTGFNLTRTLKPGYWYFNSVKQRTHPTQLRKYKLCRYYNNLDKTKTEWELLQALGWNRIWDCGQLVFVKTF